jgi:hypothetical protein
MDKLFIAIAVAAVGFGALFFPRIARGNTVNEKQNESIPVPAGSSPKGIRNNNPFNIEFRSSIDWIGQIGTDGRFAIFNTAENGIRAGMINIRTKFTRDGANTVRSLLNILSPSFENPTESFVFFVSGRLGVSPDQPLDYDKVIIPLSKAIVTFENGENPYPDSLFESALRRT